MVVNESIIEFNTTNFQSFMYSINDKTQGLMFNSFLTVIFLILITYFFNNNYSFGKSLLFSSFVSVILGIIFLSMGLLSTSLLYFYVFLLIVGFGMVYFEKA